MNVPGPFTLRVVYRTTDALPSGISAEFATRIRGARQTLPRDQVAAAVDALRQAKKVAIKFVRDSAALEVAGLQKQARVTFRRGRIRLVSGKTDAVGFDLKG